MASPGENSGGAGGPPAPGETERPDSRGPADASGLATDAVALIDSLFDYVAARLHVEGHRLGDRGRALLVRIVVVASAMVAALFGLGLASVGVAMLISDRLESRPAGPVIVGAFYLLAGSLTAAVAARRRS